MEETDSSAPFRARSIKDQLEILKVSKYDKVLVLQYLNIQSQVNTTLSKITMPKWPQVLPDTEKSLRKVFWFADKGTAATGTCLEEIQARIQDLEQQAEEQKKMQELLKESGDLNEMVMKVVSSPRTGVAGSSGKKRVQEYDQLEERAMSFLKACKKLKVSEEDDEA